VLPRSRAPAL